MEIKKLKDEDFLDDLFVEDDFPETVHMDSEEFRYNRELLNDDWFGLFEDDEMIGIACICLKSPTEAKIESFEIKENYQDNGYGTKLMKYIIQYYNFVDKIYLDCLYSDLDRFYKRFGFEIYSNDVTKKMVLNIG